MKKTIKVALLSIMLVSVLPLASAIPPKAKAKPVTCPICHMALSTKKTKADPVAMHLKPGGKVYYCCSKCTMPTEMLVKIKPKKVTKPTK